MLRAILSVIAGYAVIFMFVLVTFSVAKFAMGDDRTYQPGSWEVSTTWLVVSFVLGALAAVSGGWVCAKIARSMTAPMALAALVLVLGLIMAIPALTGTQGDPPHARTAEVTLFDAMQYSKSPTIALILNPVIGATGVLIGARTTRKSNRAAGA